MEMYFLKSAACLAVLLLFYKLLLESENMHIFKRFYLLTSVVAAIIIPIITFTSYIEPSSENFRQILITSEGVSKEASVNYLPYILTGIYVLGVLFFSIKFFRNLSILILRIRKNPKIKKNHVINVLLSEKIQPHTFFSFIFFNKKKYLNDEIPKDVKIHEEAHARQKHSMDVIFVELLQIIFWINPLIFLLKNAIKLNHEFLADRAVLRQGYSTAGYQQTLLSFSSGDLQSDLVNPINYSSIKKRFTVMKTQTSKNAMLVRSLLFVPLLAGLFYSFSSREFVEKDILQQISEKEAQINPDKDISDTVKISEVIVIKILKNGNLLFNQKPSHLTSLFSELNNISRKRSLISGKEISRAYIETYPETPMGIITDVKEIIKISGVSEIYLAMEGEPVSKIEGIHTYKKQGNSVQKKATPEMIKEHNKLVKHYNSIPKEEFKMEKEVINRIMYIRSLMTPEQKRNAEKITFDVPPPPPPAQAPRPEMNADNIAPPPPPRAPQPEMNADNMTPPPPPHRAPQMEMNAGKVAPPPSASTSQKPNKKLTLLINSGQEIIVNGRKTNVLGFAELIDKATRKWTAADYNLYGLDIKISESVSENAISRLNAEFRKTKLADNLNSDSDYIPYLKSSNLPSSPPPPSFNDLVEKGATFYYNGKEIKPGEARKLVEVEKKVYVQISDFDEKPEVRLTDKEK